MKKGVSVIVAIIGVVLFVVGLSLKVPSKALTTHSFLNDGHSVIEEYVGGDAYNYIIGASLIGGEIAGAKTQKAMFTSIGLLIMCAGALSFVHSDKDKTSALAFDRTNEAVPKQENIVVDNTITNTAITSEM